MNCEMSKCRYAFTRVVKAGCVKARHDTLYVCLFCSGMRVLFLSCVVQGVLCVCVCVLLVESRRKCNVCFCVRLSARISARGVMLGVRCVLDVCLFILLGIRVKTSAGINVTELASV